MNSPAFTLYTTMGVGKGQKGQKRSLAPPYILKVDIFLLNFWQKGLFLASSGKNEI